jgi:hypothetical protein
MVRYIERLACTHILTVKWQGYMVFCSACEGPFVTLILRKLTTDLSFRILLRDFPKSYQLPGVSTIEIPKAFLILCKRMDKGILLMTFTSTYKK